MGFHYVTRFLLHYKNSITRHNGIPLHYCNSITGYNRILLYYLNFVALPDVMEFHYVTVILLFYWDSVTLLHNCSVTGILLLDITKFHYII